MMESYRYFYFCKDGLFYCPAKDFLTVCLSVGLSAKNQSKIQLGDGCHIG